MTRVAHVIEARRNVVARASRNTNTKRLGSITVQPEQFDKLEATARKEGRSLSDVVRAAIKSYLAAKN